MSDIYKSVQESDLSNKAYKFVKNNMKGAFELTKEIADKKVESDKIGNYVLGDIDDNGELIPKYTGRSCEGQEDKDRNYDLRQRILCYTDKDTNHLNKTFPYFKFKCAENAQEAYEIECLLWHGLGKNWKLDNKNHPEKPEGTELKCPHCPELTDKDKDIMKGIM